MSECPTFLVRMSLSKRKIKGHHYLYFSMKEDGKVKTLYLGTPNKPRVEPIKQARAYVKKRIEGYERVLKKLSTFGVIGKFEETKKDG